MIKDECQSVVKSIHLFFFVCNLGLKVLPNMFLLVGINRFTVAVRGVW